ncbi:MAG: UDP-N-acetylglucosamine--N-acetylmuramyl- (pentapeptide) pyrophosphoryl-undecaprenol [Candidatus Saccharibacteria bacterium]|nr:UDP-N-acetylglucosamine--N-acetylmuramyl- (pentapeptide) pyrophosphoryl-undecaprenol [Candidatus Saccharibacteria bacterium]
MTGGGSGGHITPILAVAQELKRVRPDIHITYISQTGDAFQDIPEDHPSIDEVYHVRAGKFRRYHGEGWRQLLDLKTMYLNIRDAIFILTGLVQSYLLLRKIQPNIIFTRGSYVSVPVCLSAALQGIPYVTHDSDAIPSLTNRIIARWASVHAVALPKELYPYPADKTVTVGVPISGDYKPVDGVLKKQYRKELGLQGYAEILLVTGGGLGAQRLNTAVIENASFLLQQYPRMAIVHLTGKANEAEVQAAYDEVLKSQDVRKRMIVKGFTTDMARYSGAADVVVARGGATNLAELAVQAKPCIIVPNPLLTGGHQLKNTAALKKRGAIVELTEDQIEQELRLGHVVIDILAHPAKVQELSRQFASFALPDAAKRIAAVLLDKARPDAHGASETS